MSAIDVLISESAVSSRIAPSLLLLLFDLHKSVVTYYWSVCALDYHTVVYLLMGIDSRYQVALFMRYHKFRDKSYLI